MSQVGIADLLEAGVHFGHQTRRWNPKMRRFIHGERNGIYIIDLLKTAVLLQQAQEVAAQIAHRGGTVLFVGTKKQARDAIKEVAEAADMPYVNHRWLGGLLTNFQTINQRIRRLHDLERYETEGQLALLPTRERMAAQADLAKLRANLGGVKNMQRTPNAIFVIDLKTEAIAVREAQRLRIPIIGLVDTNCDPDGIDYVIPGNDDAMRSCALIAKAIGDVVAQGHAVFRAEEEKARAERAEQAKREAEERARREAEEQAKREAEQAKREAEEQAAKEAAEKQAAAAAAQAAAAKAAEPAPAPATPVTAAATPAPAQAAKPAVEQAAAAPAPAQAAKPAVEQAAAAPAPAQAAKPAVEQAAAAAAPAQAAKPAVEQAAAAAAPAQAAKPAVEQAAPAQPQPAEPVAKEAAPVAAEAPAASTPTEAAPAAPEPADNASSDSAPTEAAPAETPAEETSAS
ncbi:MAG TPA: 30S ribosomal protein S2 [Solirubrobacteraceae bacterium]|nr:30S ribosomal protein S2 [Solirubrobacteraceae bacterium]